MPRNNLFSIRQEPGANSAVLLVVNHYAGKHNESQNFTSNFLALSLLSGSHGKLRLFVVASSRRSK